MKISYNWLKKYVDFDLTAKELCPILTDIGLEVEGLQTWESVKGGLKGLVVGEVKTCEQHPNADKLKCTTVDVGAENLLNIVCGAPNVAKGQKVIVATVNAVLHPTDGDEFKIKKSKIRGEASEGMICAEDEIGLGKSHDGIMVLNPETKVGTPASQIFEVENDWIIEIGLTPNRSDAFSHIGTAKDLLAYLRFHNKNMQQNIKMPSVKEFPASTEKCEFDVQIVDNEKCRRFAGVVLDNIKIKESPNWLKNKLEAIGVKSINNIVDITNFIAHEIGQPLHAYDANEIIGNKILAKTLPNGTEFEALDERKFKLSEHDLVICNEKEGMCIAGVFGGLKSGVKDCTTKIFLEAANFDAGNTRRTSFRHLLRTDAAMRFEKGVDPNISVFALKRAAMLMVELADAKVVSEIIDIYPKKIEKTIIEVDLKNVKTLIGAKITNTEIKQILTALDIEIEAENGEKLNVLIPTNKPEVLREADVIEEILRIYGFNNVPIPHQIKSSYNISSKKSAYQLKTNTANWLCANGFSEIMTLSFDNKADLEKLDLKEQIPVEMLNSLNADLDILRVNSLLGGLRSIQHNQNRQNADLKFFEFGKIYWKEETSYQEKKELSIFVTGNKNSESWKSENNAVDFYDIKQIATKLFTYLGIKYKTVINQSSNILNDVVTLTANETEIANFGKVKRSFLKYFGIKNDVYYCKVNWQYVLKSKIRKKTTVFNSLAKFPKVRRDLALLIDKNVAFESIKTIATKNAKNILKDVQLFDIYEGKNLAENKKSYAVSFHFQDDKKTLTDKQVDKIMSILISKFETEIGATLR